MSKAIFSRYLNALHEINRQGDAREESFYGALADMLKKIAADTGRAHVHVTTLPRPTEGGNPDFRLWNGTDRNIGYLEAKKPTAWGASATGMGSGISRAVLRSSTTRNPLPVCWPRQPS